MKTKQRAYDAESSYDSARNRPWASPPGNELNDKRADTIDEEYRDRCDSPYPVGACVSEVGDGALSSRDCFRDNHAYSHPLGFASGIEGDAETGFKPARTNFHAKDAPRRREQRFKHLWLIHHGIDGWPECPIDEVERGHRIDRSRRLKYLVSDATLQTLELPAHVHERSTRLTVSTDCRGFSRHYDGITGAAIGWALVSLFESPTEAKTSPYWVTVEEICSSIDVDPDGLVDYAFRRFGSTERSK